MVWNYFSTLEYVLGLISVLIGCKNAIRMVQSLVLAVTDSPVEMHAILVRVGGTQGKHF